MEGFGRIVLGGPSGTGSLVRVLSGSRSFFKNRAPYTLPDRAVP